ncbi:MAG: PEP-CTERM sorting domain-containing protein [Verrucomicrobiota bacterium]
MKKTVCFVCLVGIISASNAWAALIQPNLSGSVSYDGWVDMTITNYDQSDFGGSFPGASPWVAPLAANQLNSSGATFNKVSGLGYVATVSVYSPFSPTPYEITSTTLTYDVDTVIFQIDTGPGTGNLWFTSVPTLSYNGGTQQLAADFTNTSAGSYPFTNPVDVTQTGTTTIFQYQWDLSTISNVNDYTINYTTAPHSQNYEMQLDSGDTFVQVVPEPGTAGLLGAALFILTALRRFRRA